MKLLPKYKNLGWVVFGIIIATAIHHFIYSASPAPYQVKDMPSIERPVTEDFTPGKWVAECRKDKISDFTSCDVQVVIYPNGAGRDSEVAIFSLSDWATISARLIEPGSTAYLRIDDNTALSTTDIREDKVAFFNEKTTEEAIKEILAGKVLAVRFTGLFGHTVDVDIPLAGFPQAYARYKELISPPTK